MFNCDDQLQAALAFGGFKLRDFGQPVVAVGAVLIALIEQGGLAGQGVVDELLQGVGLVHARNSTAPRRPG